MAIALAFTITGSAAPMGPGLGRPALPEEMQAWDRGVTPDGQGLPPGSGTVIEGAALYVAKCQQCHGVRGSGAAAEELAGGEHGLRADPPDKTIGTYWPYATTLYDFVRRAMPLNAPGTLTDEDVYALTAYLLHLNSILPADARIDASALAAIRMPNRDGFIPIDTDAALSGRRGRHPH